MTLAMALATIAPTIVVAVTAWRINRPGHVRDVEVELGRSLGLQITLEGVDYPRPGEVVYRGIVLRQDEPRRGGLTELARAKSARVRKTGRDLTVEVDGFALRADGPRQAMIEVSALLAGVGEASYRQVSLTAPSASVLLGGEVDDGLTLHLRDLAATFQNDHRAPSLSASYRVVDQSAATRCELSLKRDRRAEGVETVLAFKTMEGPPLPGRVLDLFFDSNAWLGAGAKVQGALTLTQTGAADWKAEFSGDLVDVDLKTLFERRFSRHRLTGLAQVSVRQSKWEGRPGQGFGWSSAEGEIRVGPGAMGVDLLQALASEMKFRPAHAVHPRVRDVAFSALGFTFALSRDGEIQLGGGFRNQYAPDDVLVENDRPIVKAPAGAANVRGLIKTLFPSSAEAMGPVTADSQALSRYLPLPPGVASRGPGRIEAN